MTEDATLSLPDAWEETRFRRDAYGPDDVDGYVATFQGDEATVEVLPVRYRREDGVETVRSIVSDWTGGRSDPSVPVPDVDVRTAFATRLRYRPFDVVRDSAVCVTTDADDALAIAIWLMNAADDARELRRHVNNHAGSGSPSGIPLADDDVLAAAFADQPERCVYTGKDTRSHRITLPYRYVPLLSAARRTGPGVPRFPSTVDRLEGMVSHVAWDEHELHDVDFAAPIERAGPEQYELAQAVVDAIAGTDAEAYALYRLGVDD